jgi:hypothetical protein
VEYWNEDIGKWRSIVDGSGPQDDGVPECAVRVLSLERGSRVMDTRALVRIRCSRCKVKHDLK